VSCDRWKFVTAAFASCPENIPMPPGEARVASPRGASATSPRASTGKMATFARIAALVVARSCA